MIGERIRHWAPKLEEEAFDGRTVINADKLSPRQIECIQLTADGFSHYEIAERMVISPGTVRRHWTNIRNRLGAKSRVHMVALAFRAGKIR